MFGDLLAAATGNSDDNFKISRSLLPHKSRSCVKIEDLEPVSGSAF